MHDISLLMPNDCALAGWRNGSIDNKQWQWISTISEPDAAALVKATCYTMNNPPHVLARLYVCSRSKWIENKWTWQILRSSFLYLKTWLDQRIQIFGHRCFPLLDICDVKTKHSCSECSAEDVETYTHLVMQWSWYLFYLMMTKPWV